MPMRRSTTQRAVTLAGVLAVVATTVLPLQPVFGGGGGARRDVVRQEEQNRTDALDHAQKRWSMANRVMLRHSWHMRKPRCSMPWREARIVRMWTKGSHI